MVEIQNRALVARGAVKVRLNFEAGSRRTASSPDERSDIRDGSNIALRYRCAHPVTFSLIALLLNISSELCFSKRFPRLAPAAQDAWCSSRHTLPVLSASSSAKEPRCSQTCRKCVWSIDGDH